MMRQLTHSVGYDEIDVGDHLPEVTRAETQADIDRFAELAGSGRPRTGKNLHSDDDFARRTIFAGTVNMGVATMAYCHESLEQVFCLQQLLSPGSRVEFKAIEPVRAGDTIAIGGSVVGKREDGDRRLVDCQLQVTNQHGRLVGVAIATVAM